MAFRGISQFFQGRRKTSNPKINTFTELPNVGGATQFQPATWFGRPGTRLPFGGMGNHVFKLPRVCSKVTLQAGCINLGFWTPHSSLLQRDKPNSSRMLPNPSSISLVVLANRSFHSGVSYRTPHIRQPIIVLKKMSHIGRKKSFNCQQRRGVKGSCFGNPKLWHAGGGSQ